MGAVDWPLEGGAKVGGSGKGRKTPPSVPDLPAFHGSRSGWTISSFVSPALA